MHSVTGLHAVASADQTGGIKSPRQHVSPVIQDLCVKGHPGWKDNNKRRLACRVSTGYPEGASEKVLVEAYIGLSLEDFH